MPAPAPPRRRVPSPRALLAAALAAVALALAGPPAAEAAGLTLGRCPGPGGAPERCGTLTVPVQRGNPAAGTFDLRVEVTPARGRRRGTILVLAGGPGQAGVGLGVGRLVRAAAAGWETVTLDQRGTGALALRCPAFETPGAPQTAEELVALVAECAAGVGPVRTSFTTADTVADLEDLRAALGRQRWVVAGVSYGTYVAQRYAAAHPGPTQGLVLDSVVGPEGPNLLLRETFAAARRVLRGLCAGRACRGVTDDLVRDVARLNARLEREALQGRRVDARGRPRADSIGGPRDPAALLRVLLEGDFSPALRGFFPAAVRAGLAGDAAPLLRLRSAIADPGPDREFSPVLFTATVCTEARVPWGPGTPPGDRLELARAAAAAAGAAAYRPFRPSDAVFGDLLAGCAGWPESGAAQAPHAGPLPPVPTLLLAGSVDLRTPVEEARRLAASLPRASLVTVPWGGHSALSGEPCVTRALGRFLAGRPVGRPCRGAGRRPAIEPVPPRRVAGLPGPARARGLSALRATFTDAIRAADAVGTETRRGVRVSGLRAGTASYVVGRAAIALGLNGYSYVPGVRVTGRMTIGAGGFAGGFRVQGPPSVRGRVTLRDGRVVGTLGGRRVSAPVRALLAS